MLEDNSKLIAELKERSENTKKTGRALKQECLVWGIPDLKITRWKFNEWDYYSEKAALPISARGLFTLDNHILVRGYNKFFNVGEVRSTKLENLRAETEGPFYATVKENGYLVLISAYQNKLVVTSKNSSGPDATNEVGRNYSGVAREWVLKHLKSAGKTEEEFAKLLQDNDWTAVGEVCDDSYEEHVLPYPETLAGIYLNGLNRNSQELVTETPDKVLAVAEEFGFRRTEYITFDTFDKLWEFLEDGQKSGKWQSREVEGFVIRCKRRVAEDTKGEGNAAAAAAAATPAAAHDFFWKFKFEEPYMMYRQWREVVRTYLNSGLSAAGAQARRSKHSESTLRFLQFARYWLEKHVELKEKLLKYNLGIIELRTKFFENQDLTEQALLEMDLNSPRWLLVTVATLGCGKSTVASVLTTLFKGEWGHVQNDGVKYKGKKGSKFGGLVNNIVEELREKDVVILDKNNSRKDERQRIFEEFDKTGPSSGFDMRYICLNFLPNGPTKKTMALTRERVIARGDNHQTVKLSQQNVQGINGIMSQFEKTFCPVRPWTQPDSNFDLVIDLHPGESVRNVHTVLNALRTKYAGKLVIPEFSDEEIDQAFRTVREAEKQIAAETPAAEPKLRPVYFGIGVSESERELLLKTAQEVLGAKDPEVLEKVKFQKTFHVTLAHKTSHKKQHNTLRSKYRSQIKNSGHNWLEDSAEIAIKGIAWNNSLVALDVQVEGSANQFPHITLALGPNMMAKQAQTLLDGSLSDVKVYKFPEPIVLQNQRLYAYV